jgi:hypothetical protein
VAVVGLLGVGMVFDWTRLGFGMNGSCLLGYLQLTIPRRLFHDADLSFTWVGSRRLGMLQSIHRMMRYCFPNHGIIA